MGSSEANKQAFFESLRQSLEDGSFGRATLSKPALGNAWKRIVISAFESPVKGKLVSLDYSDGRRVERKNCSTEEVFSLLKEMIPLQWSMVNVRLAQEEIQFEHTPQGTFRLKRRSSVLSQPVPLTHNRPKNYRILPDAPFLTGVGISTNDGIIRRERYDKYRQINKFIEIIESLIPLNRLSSEKGISAVDFGSGKHYLTFALYDYLTAKSGQSSVKGFEQRAELVSFGRQLASSLSWSRLSFDQGAIVDAELSPVDLVVALHACDTATDDALVKAIKAKAEFICVAPCCHKYVRKALQSSSDLEPILRHGILEERFCESLTDSLRVLALEAVGYQAKLFEFISLEHTAKNVMITASRTGRENVSSREAIVALRNKFGLKDFYLDNFLGL